MLHTTRPKHCPGCKTTKPPDQFYRYFDKQRQEWRLAAHCKSCLPSIRRKYAIEIKSAEKVQHESGYKKCTRCKKEKELAHFRKTNWSRDGLEWHCKECEQLKRELRRERLESLPRPTIESKHCGKCDQTKSSKFFHKNRASLDGLASYCKKCYRRFVKDCRLRKMYGITHDQYDALVKKQNGACAICQQPQTKVTRTGKQVMPLAVDHCHKTSKVRGLLCDKCNSGIGQFNNSRKLLRRAIDYLTSASHSH